MNIKCPICNSIELTSPILDLKMCQECGHLFKNVGIDKKTYENYASSSHTQITPIERTMVPVNMRMNFLIDFKKKGKLLEIGCGHKYFLDTAKRAGFDVEGTELSKILVAEIPYKMHLGNPSEIKQLDKYDIICAFHVLEHINDPVNELRVLTDHLNEDGVIIIEIPAMIFYDMDISPNMFYEALHTQYFNQVSIVKLLHRCGLEIIKQTSYWDGKIANTMICAVKDNDKLVEQKLNTIKTMAI